MSDSEFFARYSFSPLGSSPLVVDAKGKGKAFGNHIEHMDVESDLDDDMDFDHNVSMFERYGAHHVKTESTSGSGSSGSGNTSKTYA